MMDREKLLKLAITGKSESKYLDFKEDFNYDFPSDRLKLLKHIIAMTNTGGGVIVFGVDNFGVNVHFNFAQLLSLDTAVIGNFIESYTGTDFDSFEFVEIRRGSVKKMALLIFKSNDLVIFSKQGQYKDIDGRNKSIFEKGDLYFRHGSKSEKCSNDDLRLFANQQRMSERKALRTVFSRVIETGPQNAAILDIDKGSLSGVGGNLLIDADLLSKIKFIKEGQFSETGKPTLKLVGNVQPVDFQVESSKSKFRFSNEPGAIPVSDNAVLKQYPLTYQDLVAKLKLRYINFKVNLDFHNIKNGLMKNPMFAHERFLYPERPKSAKAVFFSNLVIKEFDKHYKKK